MCCPSCSKWLLSCPHAVNPGGGGGVVPLLGASWVVTSMVISTLIEVIRNLGCLGYSPSCNYPGITFKWPFSEFRGAESQRVLIVIGQNRTPRRCFFRWVSGPWPCHSSLPLQGPEP